MTIPERIYNVLTSVAHRDASIQKSDQDLLSEWLNDVESLPSWSSLDSDLVVEVPINGVSRGDLLRIPQEEASTDLNHGSTSDDGIWVQVLDVQIHPGDSWYFSIPYGDPETGMYEGVYFEHDSNYLSVLTCCDVCNKNQAVRYIDTSETNELVNGRLCNPCIEYNPTPHE